ncbi:ABC transporter related [Staphylothermus marinus F1]|uniref:ABC transporter related n=1 Tax=Staphylothermus marinus (strain ATCC 43588 / DSM 3639 / JCM 9404 / F1) TaxID=399550 RepID=A3DKX2_STAMF|nr:ABC transporter ATP-binding protein [Staphylothermus marinus]ABN69282.1 ABC transporter related [Staphylothermus marinus F1]
MTRHSDPLVVVEDLEKIYSGKTHALKGISFKIYPGEIFGLIGPNGAGKTTTLRIIATILSPTRGDALVDGYSVSKNPGEVRKRISYLPEEAGAYKYLKGYEFLEFIAGFFAKNREERDNMVKEAVKISGLGNKIHDKIKTYSKGMLRRLLIAKTLMIKPKLAILDEPTSGLDVINAMRVRKIIKNYSREYGVTVLLSSHNMLEVEFLCDRVAIIHEGRIIAKGSPVELKTKYEALNLEEVFMKIIGEE